MRCEFIMAMLHRPQIVFLDEPTIGLDVVAKEKIRSFIKTMNEQGVTFILTTHDLGDVERLAKRVILINRGELIFDNTIEALRGYLGKKKFVTVRTANPGYSGFFRMRVLNLSPSTRWKWSWIWKPWSLIPSFTILMKNTGLRI